MSTLLHQSVGNILTLKSYRMGRQYCNDFSKQSDKMEKVVVKSQLNQQLMMIAIEGVVVFCTMIIYGIGFYQVMYGQMSLGSVVSMGLYFQMLVPAFVELSNSNLNLQHVLPCFERVESYKQLVSESQDGVEMTSVGQIETVNLSFAYQAENYVLKQLNFKAVRSRITMICGKSGSGKTTLIKLLMGYNKPTAGAILMDGTLIHKLSTDALRKGISYVQQEVELFPMSVMMNIKADCQDITDENVYTVCKQMGIYEDIIQLENGFETVINEQLNLSGGQKQKIGIVRALVRKPEILVLDEPTSAMDATSEEKLMQFIDQIKSSCTIIVISHRKSTFAYADDLYYLDAGMLIKIDTKGAVDNEMDCNGTSNYRAI
jgi:ABC-type bacteriocin/lantibiotic exporter with double-glycine peptidase domain